MRKNVASQVIGAQMVSATDGSAFTGSVTVAVTVDGGTQATGSVGSGACTHEGGGFHTYAPAQAETNGNHLAFTFSGTGAVPVTIQVYPVGFDETAAQVPANVTHFGGSAGTFASGRPEVNTSHIAGSAVSTSAAQIGVNVVNAGGTAWGSGAITAASIANGAIDAATFAADVDAEILSYLVDDATRIDASALNTATGTTIPAILTDTAEIGAAGAGLTEAGGTGDHLTAVPWNAAWDAEVQSEVQDAVEANHLDHLLAATYDPASKPGAADALLNELVENDGGVSRFTANALENAPTGGSAPTAEAIADEVQTRTIAAVTTVGTVNALAANSVNASALAADAVSELQSGLATSAALSTVSGLVDDLESRLTATRAGYLDNLSGGAVALQTSVDTLEASASAIEADTLDIQSRLPAALVGGRIDATVDGIGLEAGAIDALWDETVGDGTITMRQALRVLLAGMAGKLSGAATTTVTIRNTADSANVIVATVDSDGNRSAVTLNP